MITAVTSCTPRSAWSDFTNGASSQGLDEFADIAGELIDPLRRLLDGVQVVGQHSLLRLVLEVLLSDPLQCALVQAVLKSGRAGGETCRVGAVRFARRSSHRPARSRSRIAPWPSLARRPLSGRPTAESAPDSRHRAGPSLLANRLASVSATVPPQCNPRPRRSRRDAARSHSDGPISTFDPLPTPSFLSLWSSNRVSLGSVPTSDRSPPSGSATVIAMLPLWTSRPTHRSAFIVGLASRRDSAPPCCSRSRWSNPSPRDCESNHVV